MRKLKKKSLKNSKHNVITKKIKKGRTHFGVIIGMT